MYRSLLVLTFLFGMLSHSIAQTDTLKQKKYNHYVGIQANELIRQLINLNNNPTAVTNPYLLTYSISCAKSGWGVHVGLGYDYSRIVDNNTPSSRETKVNHFFYRIGAEKKSKISKRFEAGYSFDFTGNRQIDKTFSQSITNTGSGIDSVVTTVSNKITSIGGGIRGSIGYYFSEKIILATEATLYYSSEKQKQNVHIVDTFIDLFNTGETTITTSNQNTGADTDKFKMTIPIALFLIIKF